MLGSTLGEFDVEGSKLGCFEGPTLSLGEILGMFVGSNDKDGPKLGADAGSILILGNWLGCEDGFVLTLGTKLGEATGFNDVDGFKEVVLDG